MRQLVWSNDALRDFNTAIFHITKDDHFIASPIVDRIDAAATLLAKAPIGRQGRVKGTYEKLALKSPYIVADALTDQTVTILRVIHTSRDWRDEGWPLD
jgi:plasmid stabilization system protein ParE